ncbi:heavy metal translocating P-type ATPase [Halorubrum vacuolatum]|uniref:Cu2+-exporting ATPase n=1 Tax=Halorubrum vacuolatum TaxID=63740 RepID=A0A238UY74_HALVU|nr:cation-translocating P-type ATPase [Halorubrum vacuolatum]SNR26259.1 Cu2+-exporting ATPase [Halorubrum vacuolatum]
MSNCTLCDLPTEPHPVTASDVEGEYCCRGCLAVASSLDDISDAEELERRTPAARTDDDFDGETAFLHVDGMHCSTCESFLELTAGNQPGVEAAEASYATDTIRVEYDPDRVSPTELPERLSVAGYVASDRAEPEPVSDDVAVVRFLIGGGFFGMMTMLWYIIFLYPTYFGYDPIVGLGGIDGLYLFAHIWLFTSIVLFYTGFPILRGAYVSLRARQPNMDLLVSVAALSSYAYSTLAMLVGRTDLYFDVTVAVVLVVIAGNHYESRIKRRATGLLSDLTTAGEGAVRLASGETVPPAAVEGGDKVLVRPGERIPFDGTVDEGTAAVDEALITGESLPRTKRAGDPVRGGTVVTDAPVVVTVGEGATSTLDTLVGLLWEIQSSRSGIQRLVDKLATIFVPLVLALAAVVGAVYLFSGASLTAAALIALTVVIVSCPCALGLATPLAIASGIRDAARRGIVIVSDVVFEDGEEIDTVVLDKTGTLTDGEMGVLEVVPVGVTDGDRPAEADPIERILDRAAALERFSVHPVARAIVESVEPIESAGAARTDGGADVVGGAEPGGKPPIDGSAHTPVDTDSVSVLDRGVGGRVDDAETLVGHRSLFEDGWDVPEEAVDAADRAESGGYVPVFVGWGGVVRGIVVVGDELREGWEAVVTRLADGGKRVVVLTGDSMAAASRFREHPAIDETFAEVPPEAKAETVRRLAAEGRVAMVGDGSNDAPALAAADLGVSVASGTDLAADAADAVLLDDRLEAIPELFTLTRGTNRRITVNLGWAFLYNAIAIPLAITGLLNPLFAALAMAASSIVVVTNSARRIPHES